MFVSGQLQQIVQCRTSDTESHTREYRCINVGRGKSVQRRIEPAFFRGLAVEGEGIFDEKIVDSVSLAAGSS